MAVVAVDKEYKWQPKFRQFQLIIQVLYGKFDVGIYIIYSTGLPRGGWAVVSPILSKPNLEFFNPLDVFSTCVLTPCTAVPIALAKWSQWLSISPIQRKVFSLQQMDICRPGSNSLTTIVLLSEDLDRLYELYLRCLSTYN